LTKAHLVRYIKMVSITLQQISGDVMSKSEIFDTDDELLLFAGLVSSGWINPQYWRIVSEETHSDYEYAVLAIAGVEDEMGLGFWQNQVNKTGIDGISE